MAFEPNNLTLWSVPPRSGFYGLPQWWGYYTTDDMAAVQANYYFNLGNGFKIPVGGNSTWFVGDLLYCVCSDGVIQLQIASLDDNGTTVITSAATTDIPAGSITTAMLGANIVTAAKIANATITTAQIAAAAGITFAQLAALTSGNILVGNGSNVAASVAMTGDVAISNAGLTTVQAGAITSGKLASNTIQYVQVPLTLANLTGMYAAPVSVIAAPAAGNLIYVNNWSIDYIYGSAALTAGGAVGLQYGSSAHLAGVAASATIAAASLTGLSANGQVGALGAMGVGSNSATAVYISNATQAFATGTGGTANLNIWYSIYAI